MSVAKVIEISSESPESFEAAVRHGIERAQKTVKGIKGAWVSEQQVRIDNGKIVGYRVHMRLTFELS